MTLTELVDELMGRGFEFFDQDAAGQARAARYVNGGRAELDRMFLWPWRQTTATGAAPLTVTDLGPIQSVTDASGCALRRMDAYGDLTQTGSPHGYYADWSSGSPTVAVYPTSTESITVHYWKVTPKLTAGSDTPVSPEEAHDLIVDLAVRRVYREMENQESAESVQGEIDRQIDALLFQYPTGQADGPDAYTATTGASTDG